MVSDQLFNSEFGKGPKVATKVAADIILGMPSQGCSYHGICKIEDQLEKKCKKYLKVLFSIVDQQLQMEVKVKEVKPEIFDVHFGSGFFIILESVEIPNFLSKALNQKYTIQQGIYKVNKRKNIVEIRF